MPQPTPAYQEGPDGPGQQGTPSTTTSSAASARPRPFESSASSESGAQPTTGAFRFWFATRRWEWSPEVYRMHGYRDGEIEPTTELLLAHKHPDDREHVAEAIIRSIDQGEPFSSRHRFIDVHGGEHEVMVVADRILDDDGNPVGTAGFYVDLSGALADAQRATLDYHVPELVEGRAAIEQAKAVLMRIYQITADQAFRVLVWRSQETNTKLRALAEQLIAELSTIPAPEPSVVTRFDHILLTLHERIPKE